PGRARRRHRRAVARPRLVVPARRNGRELRAHAHVGHVFREGSRHLRETHDFKSEIRNMKSEIKIVMTILTPNPCSLSCSRSFLMSEVGFQISFFPWFLPASSSSGSARAFPTGTSSRCVPRGGGSRPKRSC